MIPNVKEISWDSDEIPLFPFQTVPSIVGADDFLTQGADID
jgi:hypothetical protein